MDLSRKISREELNVLPLYKYTGVIHLIKEEKELLSAVEALQGESILGFDTETRPAFRRGENYKPCLLQLAGPDEVYLFQLDVLKNVRPLFFLLSQEHIRKVGIAIRDDIRKLKEIISFEERGFVEIGDLAKKLEITYTGLRTLCALLLRVRISKKAQTSNWSRQPLTPAQITYAATDAWVCREIYLRLQSK